MRRREVLKAGGVLGAAAFLEGCGGRERAQIEQVLDRSRTPPGTARWNRSICGQCSGGCELLVRTIDGRAKKIEGDATSRVSFGGVCALGHSALQGQYLPQRPTQPLRRTAGDLEATSWEQALEDIAPKLKHGGAVALCCGPDPIERVAAEAVASRLGASITVVESPVAAIERAAMAQWIGSEAQLGPTFHDADLLITLGASPLDRWGNPVRFARRIAEARARGLRWVHVAERMSLSAARADLWIAPRPGASQRMVGFLDVLTGAPETAVDAPTIGSAADALDVSAEKLHRLGRWMADAARVAVIVGGEDLNGLEWPDDGADPVSPMVDRFRLARRIDAGPKGRGDVHALEALSPVRAALGEGADPDAPSTRSLSLEELALACARGEVRTVVALGVDPLAAVPRSWGLAELEPERLISVADRMDETARRAGWVLPAQTDLEQTQAVCSPETGELLIADGVVDPRGEARHPLDVLRALALAGGVDPSSLPYEDAEDLRSRLVESVANLGGGTAARALRGALRDDGRLPLNEPAAWRTALPEATPPDSEERRELPVPRALEGAEVLALQLFEAPRGEGGAFDRPWIAELPDPISTVMWGGWIELSPADAERLGLTQGAAVEVAAADDPERIVASTAYIHPACRPGTAAMPLGVFRVGERRDAALDLIGTASVAGVPTLRAAVRVQPATGMPAPIFGRGLRSAEQIPAGWKAHEHASLDGTKSHDAASGQVVALRRLQRRPGGRERS